MKFFLRIFSYSSNEETINSYRKAGIDRALFALPSENKDQILKLLDTYQYLLK